MVRAIGNGVGFDTINIIPVPKLKTTTNTYIDLFDTDNEYIPLHILILSKNISTSTHYTGTTYNFGEETCNFDEGWKPRAFYGYLEFFGMQEINYYAFQKMYFIKYSNWCDAVNNLYTFLVMYLVNYSTYDHLRYYCNTANKIYYQVRVIQVPLRFWNVLVRYCMQFFSGIHYVHHSIQQQVPYLCNFVQVHKVCHLLNNNIKDVIQYTYIDYDTIDTSTSITGMIQGINNTVISTSSTTSKNTYQGIYTVPYVPVIQVQVLVIRLSVILPVQVQVLIKLFIPVPNVPGIQVQVPLFPIFLIIITVTNYNRMKW